MVPNSKDVRIDSSNVLKDGTAFRWSTFGLPLESRVNEFVPYTRIGWYGYTPGAARGETTVYGHVQKGNDEQLAG